MSRKNVFSASNFTNNNSATTTVEDESTRNQTNLFAKRNSTGDIRRRSGVVELRDRNKKDASSINEKFITKSYIYSDPSEMNSILSTLFDYVLIVGLDEHKTCSTDQLNLYEYFSKLKPVIVWKYPDEVLIYRGK